MPAIEHWFIGECMVELRRTEPGLLAQSFAGDVYNTAVYFERLLEKGTSCFVSATGTDSVSMSLLEAAASHGLDARHVDRINGRQPGLYWIETDARGERSFLYWRTHSAARAMLDDRHCASLQAHIETCRLLYFSGITLAILDENRRARLLNLARHIKAAGGMVAFDSNYRPSMWESAAQAVQWCDAALGNCTHALVTFEDEQQLHGDPAPSRTLERLLDAGAREAIVKLGEQGCLAQSTEMTTPIAAPAVKAEPVDTTAAGDSFNAAYLAARITGKPIEDAAQAGCRLAARVISFPGAIIDKAAWPEIHRSLA